MQQLAQTTLHSQLTLNAIQPPGPSVFGDERDSVLMHFNWLQASSGTGKGIVYNDGTMHQLDLTSGHLVCRLKVSNVVCENFFIVSMKLVLVLH